MNDNVVQLIRADGEARVDTAFIADHLKARHKAVIQLVRTYASDFEELGRVAFEMRPFSTPGGMQRREVALLNEDQCYLLLAYSRNTARVRRLKINLVKAFRDARRQADLDSVLNLVLLPEPATWEKRFGEAYYRALAKITRTHYDGHAGGTPAIFGQLTDRWVYSALLPREVHAELKARRGASEKMHQWLTDGGKQKLDQQISLVTTIAETSCDLKDFEARCMQRFGTPGQLRLVYPVAA